MKLTSIESIARALNGAGVPFLVVGGLAVVAQVPAQELAPSPPQPPRPGSPGHSGST